MTLQQTFLCHAIVETSKSTCDQPCGVFSRNRRGGDSVFNKPLLISKCDTGTLAESSLLDYYPRALTTSSAHHVFVILADLLAAISLTGLLVIVYSLFMGARAAAEAETDRRRV